MIGASMLAVTCATGSAAQAVPSKCMAAGRASVEVRVQAPAGAEVGGLSLVVDYPEAAVALPQSGDAEPVRQRVKGLPAGFMNTINDTDETLRIALASGNEKLADDASFKVEFDRCEGATMPPAKAFGCTVESAAMTCGLPLDNVTCDVVIK